MSPLSLFLIIISSFFHAVWNVLTQTSQNSQYFSGLKGLWIIAFGVGFFLFTGSPLHYDREILGWAALSGLLHGTYILSLSRAYSTQDISYVYPIARSAPVFVPVFAFFLLGEQLSLFMVLAIGIILVAIYTLHFEGHLVQGFKNLFEAIRHRDLRWAFYTLGLVVSYSLVDKKGMDVFFRLFPGQAYMNGAAFFFLEAVIGFTLCNLYLAKVYPVRHILSVWKVEWKKACLAGAATLMSYGLICVVLQYELVSSVVSLRQTSVLMVVYWGCWKLDEPFGRQRLIAGGLTCLGVGIMAWAP
ncbi:hypothetical protein UZ36_02175 [Candidatus Nitromaritima sp. SCGC AAA799-C22]|nr:hypothetical protein UZ36_02175 [Candidatus Nitromaritima sp. SCGC AAA799-C22]